MSMNYIEEAERELQEEKDFLSSKITLADLNLGIEDSRRLFYLVECLATGLKDDEKLVKEIKKGKKPRLSLNGGKILIHHYMIEEITKLFKGKIERPNSLI